ncbi:MAG TPA: RusA family crossover junction endodeoxyribonuclease [Candidatus Hydrogenedentes bacterium]|nr:RusA family crossover junction endodeoxyribonuclease [Candidatus Hydrogenedentota bacterium]
MRECDICAHRLTSSIDEPCMSDINFFVPGIPATQGSKKWVGGHRIVDTCKSLPQWRKDVATIARLHAPKKPIPKNYNVYMKLHFYLPRPKSHYGTGRNAGKLKKGAPAVPRGKDLTKMLRAVEDSLSGIIFEDDDQVSLQLNSKNYADDCGSGVSVSIQYYQNQCQP